MEGVSGSTGALLKSDRGEGYSILGSDINCDENILKPLVLSFFWGSSAEFTAASWQKDIQKNELILALQIHFWTVSVSSETFERLEVYGLTNPVV